jgi:hypothetical protein
MMYQIFLTPFLDPFPLLPADFKRPPPPLRHEPLPLHHLWPNRANGEPPRPPPVLFVPPRWSETPPPHQDLDRRCLVMPSPSAAFPMLLPPLAATSPFSPFILAARSHDGYLRSPDAIVPRPSTTSPLPHLHDGTPPYLHARCLPHFPSSFFHEPRHRWAPAAPTPAAPPHHLHGWCSRVGCAWHVPCHRLLGQFHRWARPAGAGRNGLSAWLAPWASGLLGYGHRLDSAHWQSLIFNSFQIALFM